MNLVWFEFVNFSILHLMTKGRQTNYRKGIVGRTILVTGGTGSFGGAVVRRLLEYDPKRIVIYSRDEKKQFDMRNEFGDSEKVLFVIGDVRDRRAVERVVEGVDYVFHAAALKHVPSCEYFPMEAVKTNVLGAHNVLEQAIRAGVDRVVILSTDKAVYPINAMGISKALMEKIMIASSRRFSNGQKTVLCGTRYGNVMYTRGSVIPYFVKLYRQNKKLTITSYEMTRFMMPLWQSVDLVLHALTEGENGDMYVRKAPACTLLTLARAFSKIFKGAEHHEVGIRAGEKIHETLVSSEEMSRAVDEGDYYRIPRETQGLEYEKYHKRGKEMDMGKIIPFSSNNTKMLGVIETVELLLSLPEIQNEVKNK